MELTEEQQKWKDAVLCETGPTFLHFACQPLHGLMTGMCACISAYVIAHPGTTVLVLTPPFFGRASNKLVGVIMHFLRNEGNIGLSQQTDEDLTFYSLDDPDLLQTAVHIRRAAPTTKGIPEANLLVLWELDGAAYEDFFKYYMNPLYSGTIYDRTVSFSHSDGSFLREQLGLLEEDV